MKASIKKIEYYLPSKIEDGADLAKDNPEWRIDDIESKTGIYMRHIAADQDVVEMGRLASERIFDSGVDREKIDLLILVTQSPVYPLPTSACILHGKLHLKKSCMAFDVNLGCSGFVYALAMCSSLIETGVAKKGLIVCSENYTKYIEPTDRTCRPLFSDGAAATFVVNSDTNSVGPFELGTDGYGYNDLIVKPNEDDSSNVAEKIYMNGSSVFMFTMNMIPKCVNKLLNKANITLDDIDMFIFHQASKLVIDNLIRRMDISEEKVFINYAKVGNTVSASIPIALKQAIEEGRLHTGDAVMLIGFGVGLSWGACTIKCDIES